MPDWVFQLITAGAAAGGVYGAIRADLARLHERTDNAVKGVSRAHERIDELFNHHTRRS